MTHSFPQVRDFDPIQRPPPSFAQWQWNFLFLADFVLGLTTKPDGEGHVVKKSDYPGVAGRLHRSLYAKLAQTLERRANSESFVQPLPVPSVESTEWTAEDFTRWRLHANSPLVIKGLLKDSRAVSEWSESWLVTTHGDVSVRCIDQSAMRSNKGKLQNAGENIVLHETSLREFFTNDQYEDFYINNVLGVFTSAEFESDCDGTKLDQLRGSRRQFEQWFISRSRKSASGIHAANGDNLFVNLKGVKEWHFIHPDYTAYIMPALSRFAVYAVSALGDFGVDDYDEQYQAFPHLRLIPKLACQLDEGDVLYNPPWWWHNVQNRSDFNVGCATRYIAHATGLRNIPLFHLCQAIDAVKHPRKSFLTRGTLASIRKRSSQGFADSIFSGRPPE